MSDFLAGALEQARTNLTAKKAAGVSYGKTENIERPTKRKAKWLADNGAILRSKSKAGAGRPDSGLSDYDLERSRKALERKEKQYRKMFNRGTDMHLEGEAAENLLIDFDRKWAEGHRQESSDEEDDRQLASDDESDPVIEIEDEFGRMRKIRKSQALRHEKPVVVNTRPANLIHGPHMQSYNPDAKKKDQIWAEEEASKEVHYDPKFEVRQRGAGFINLGRGQDRKQRMEDLSRTRTETLDTRTGHGLSEPDIPPLVTIPHEAGTEDLDYIHPSRRQQLPDRHSKDTRDAEHVKVGQAFLDSLL